MRIIYAVRLITLVCLLALSIVGLVRIVNKTQPPPGRWGILQAASISNTDLTDEQQREIRKLESIGYLAGSSKAPDMANVVTHDRNRAWQGLNFYTSGHAPEALLMDMDGKVLHRWQCTFKQSFPNYPQGNNVADMQFWRRALLLPDGSILAIHEGLGLVKLDKDSNILWAWDSGAHHDLFLGPEGRIYVLTRSAHLSPLLNSETPILEDYISILSPEGVEQERISLLECFQRASDDYSWRQLSKSFWKRQEQLKLANPESDIFHTNSIELLDGQIADREPAFARGNILTAFRHLDTIAVIDPKARKVVWALSNKLSLQHDPTITPDGGLLVFDNHWSPGHSSRVVVFDAANRTEEWAYTGSSSHPFYSPTCGTAQALSNGNILITESDNGRAFEVTPEKQIVWEFFNPHRAGKNDELIATLFEVTRFPEEAVVEWLRIN